MKIGPLQINLRRLGIFISIGVFLVLVMNFNARLEELARLQGEAATVRAQATAILVTQAALETQVALATSPAAVEEYARNQARMAQPGDKVFVVIPAPGSTPQPMPTATPIMADLTKWDVWMLLIFGK
jgi:cell division protein FtsB